MAFPTSPTVGDLYTSASGQTFIFGTNGGWKPDGLTATGSTGVIGSAVLGTPVLDDSIVLSSDGAMMINTSGASITPTTGLTEANMITDGFVSVSGGGGSTGVIGAAALGVAVPDDSIVMSSDGSLMLNNSGASITPTTGITEANMVTDGFVSAGSSTTSLGAPLASFGNSVPIGGMILSSDGTLMVNNTGAAITPTTGLTEADLTADGFTSTASSGGGGNAEMLVVQEVVPDGSSGGTATAGAYTLRTMNTIDYNGLTGAGLAASIVTLPAGTYLVTGHSTFASIVQNSAVRVRFNTAAKSINSNSCYTSAYGIGHTVVFSGTVVLAAADTCQMEYYCSQGGANKLGFNVGDGVEPQILSAIVFNKIA